MWFMVRSILEACCMNALTAAAWNQDTAATGAWFHVAGVEIVHKIALLTFGMVL